MNSLQPGQICEIADAYVGMIDEVPARVIVHRLTKQQQQKRLQDQVIREKKKQSRLKLTLYKLSLIEMG